MSWSVTFAVWGIFALWVVTLRMAFSAGEMEGWKIYAERMNAIADSFLKERK